MVIRKWELTSQFGPEKLNKKIGKVRPPIWPRLPRGWGFGGGG